MWSSIKTHIMTRNIFHGDPRLSGDGDLKQVEKRV